jgi:acetyl esterase/lipase
MLCLKDLILPYHLISYCLDAYRGDFNVKNNMFLSPIFVDNLLLKKFPPVRILVGTADALRDDCFRYLKKLLYV